MKVPLPVIVEVVKHAAIKCPAKLVLATIVIGELTVPPCEKQALPVHAGPPTGVITVGSKLTWKSIPETLQSVVSPMEIGTEIVPGVAITFGIETETGTLAGLAVQGAMIVEVFEMPCSVFETTVSTGALTVCNPKNSAAVSIKAKREFSEANAVTFINRANASANRAKPFTL